MKYLYVFILTSLLSCIPQSQLQLTPSTSADTKIIREGWVDANTFRVVAIGAPKEDLQSKVKRRITSREAAITMAQKLIVERFKGSKITGKTDIKEGTTISMTTSKEFQGIIQGGVIIYESYDEEDNCEIIYQISGENLQSKLGVGIR
mgnify:CR=1 FL=1